ncbi:MAG: hypothetical protein IPP38_12080 [Bacteroidetes bacterium]|nr:hypothetical protein [Bacteroidota bacterium]
MKNLYSPPSKIVTKIVWISILVLGLSDFSAAQTISATCSGASQITVGNCTTNQNVSDATVNDPNASGCITSPTRDGWFYFVATSARTQVDFFNNSNRDAGIIVYSGSCGSLTAIGCVNATGSSGDELLIVNTSVGSTYRIRILRISGTTTNLNGSVCVNELPSITSFSPSPVCTGGTITITGSGFTGTTAVTVNGTAVTSFNVVSGTSITAVVAAGTTTGTINVTNGTGSGTSASSLTVNSTPVATATPSTQTLCGSGSTSVALSSSVGGTSYIWTVAQTNVSGGSNCASACGSSIAQSLSNINGTTSGSAVYTITPATASCTGSPITATITVNPKPVGSAANSTPAICSGTGPADALSSTVAGTAYTWTVSQSGVSGGSTCSSSCGTSINQTLTATGAVAGTATYTVTPTASSCAGNTFTVTVTVNPKPVGTATPSTGAFCGSGTTNINLSSTVAGTSYSWTIAQSNATGSAACPSACGTNIADVISSTSNTPGTVTYTITPATALCTGNTFTSTMTVNPIPTGTATPSTKTICSVSGPAIALSSTVSGTSYTWTVSQSGVSGGSNCSSSCGTSINQSLTTSSPVQGTATYTVTPTANGCPGSTLTADITVNPVPVATSTPSSQTICGGGTTGFALTSTVAGTNFAWTVVQTNVTGATAGSGSSIAQTLSAAANAASGTSVYTVTPTSGAGCTGSTITASATVLASPTAVSVSPSSITICPGANTSLNASGGPVAITYISGTGSSTTTSNTSASTLGPNPLQNYYGGSKQQTMWRSSELIALGLVNGSKINSITINLATAGTTYALLNYRIKYQLSSSVTALSTTPITTGWTTIYGPQSYTPVSGINTFTFSSPIVWDGTSALILEFNFSNNNTGSTGTLNTATYNTGIGYTATNFYRADNVTAASVDAFSSTVNFSYSSRNNVQFNVTQPVSYSWLPVTGLNVSTGTTVVASPASSTTYTVSGTLANGCSSTATSSVSINPAISISFTSTNVSCNGGTNGSATANPTGGNGSFVSYLWSNGQTTATATGLIAGTYSVTVTDGLGCTASNSVVVSEPTQLVASCSVVSHVTCNGGTDGSASVSASGGTAPYTGEGTFTGLAAGTYSYTITDANGCTASCSVTITEPAALVATCSVVSHVTCNGGTDGSASVSASGGTAPFTGEGTFTGLAAGTYSYTVTDANGCTASCSVTITEPAVLVATCTVVSNVSCNGGSDGAFNVSASGGTGPYTGTGGYIGAVAGTNTITVTDANGCTTSCSVTITEPSALSASCTWVSDVTCNGGNDGSATVSASGGTGPYTGTGLVSGLSAGTQTLTVTDANGCTATCTVVINQPSALVATCSVGSNVTCNGGSDGSASVSASGGVGPYTGEGTFTGLSAGTYSYTVTDASGCTATCSVTITEPAALVATCTVVSNVSCNGGSDGAFNVSASGGTGPYSGTGAYAGAVAGTNTITVTDANGCTTSCSVTITEPAVLIATCTVVSNVSCNGGSDGAFNVSASGGTGPYSGTGAYAGAVAGTNTITVTDANGCTATCTVTITEPSALSVSCTWVSDVTCNGGNDGSATVSASGGTGPYTGTGLVGGLSAGTQTLTVTDANGCTATCTVVINEPAALVASCSVVSHVTCNGGTDGSASVSASGGTAPYTGEGPFTGLAAGTYSYTITDANGCTASCSVTITEPAVLVATCTVVSNVSCNGGSDGAFNVSASGGTGPYSGTGAYAGAVAGTNTITVTDANGCTTSCSVTITEPAVLVATCTVVSNVSCNGGSDGAFNVSASGGTGPYTGTGSYAGAVAGTNTITVTDANGCTATCSVTITEPAVLVATCSVVSNVSCNGGTDGSASVSASGGTAPYSGTGSFTGLAAGTYNYTVTDANGCTASCSVTISEPAALVATCSVVSNVTCNGGTDGSASVSASGGTAPYSGEGTFPGLAAGTYNYTVTDANGCTASCSVTISEPAALVATCSVVSNVSCNGGTDGSASVSASGGAAPYSGEGTFSGLAAGTYSYTVTDANGCTASCSVTISEPAALVATCTVVSNVSCNGGSDGAFNVSASGGTGPYTGTGGYAGAVAGTNVITVTDANGCTATCSVTITEPAVLVATCSVVSNVSCNGGTDGSASVSGSGGTAPYSGTGSFSGLAAGTYNYTVTDANGCTASCSVTISEPAALVATCSVVSNVTCNGGTDGSASVSASGGVAPYSGEGTFTGLAAGTYNYTVTDANGCTASCSVTISEPAALVATCTVVSNVSCNGGSDGAFNVSASGGTGPYTGTGGYAGAVAGTNAITVTDANGCTATCSVTITEPAVLVATCSVVSNVSCNGGTDGSASVSASGGTAPYSGTGSFTGLAAGTYNYTVTDANGCTASCSVTITEPAALVATCSIVSNVTCNGGSDGSASVSASGGVGPYSGEGTFTGLFAGTYSYTVTDANGCTASCSVTITEPAVLVATCTVVSNVSCNGGSDGAFNVSASGGTGPYTGTGGYAGAVAGTNTITVTDANGCTATCSVTISEPAALVATCSVVSNVSCNGGTDGSASVSASGGTAPYSGTGSFTGLAAGTYNYTVTDANGCTASCSVTIEPARLPVTLGTCFSKPGPSLRNFNTQYMQTVAQLHVQ